MSESALMMGPAQLDFVNNGAASGLLASTLLKNGFDMKAFRPWEGEDGKSYIARVNNGKLVAVPTFNSSGLLRKDDWKLLDESIVKTAKQRLKLVGDIRGAGLNYSIPNGMGKTVLETEVMSDVNEATISLDGLRQTVADRPKFDIKHLPLPIVHKDFFISARQLAASRQGGSPFDTTMGELAGRRVAELVEQLTTGSASSYAYAGGTIYGLTNFPDRNTKVLTAPTATAWVPATTVNEVLDMRQKSVNDNMFGDWNLYVSLDWDPYLDRDYTTATSQPMTLRERLMRIKGIKNIITLDYLSTPFNMVLVQMTADVIRMVVGQEMTTIQWETQGGMQLNFKVLCIIVPQIRSDMATQCGIVHGAPA